MYERSYMHRDAVTHTVVTPRADFVVTGSADGVLKFWKKTPKGVEFVKTFRAHLGPIAALAVSPDGLRLASVGESDCALKLFDVLSFDMTDMCRLPFAPAATCWMYRKGAVEPLLAVSDRHSSVVHIYQADDLSAGKRAGSAASAGGGDEGAATALAGAAADDSDAIVIGSVGSGGRAWGSGGSSSSSASTSSATVAGSAAAGPSAAAGASAGTIGTPAKYTVALHSAPVLAMAYNALANAVVSCDGKGMIEYWSADPDARFEPPRAAADKAAAATSGAAAIASGEVAFGFKYETDLYALAKAKTFPVSLAVSPGGDRFVVASTDRRVRVFGYVTGKLEREYSEAVEEYEAQHKAGTLGLEALDYGRRIALEKELTAATIAQIKAFIAPPPIGTSAAAAVAGGAPPVPGGYRLPPSNAIFDESGHFVLFPTMMGVKVVNTVTNKVCVHLGLVENTERFLSISLFQGVPKASSQYNVAKTGSAVPVMSETKVESGSKLDPTLFTAAYKRNRFYMFTRREPADLIELKAEGRDVFNEPPSKEDLAVAAEATAALQRAKLGSEAVIHTTMGDIFIKLLPDSAPKANENFCGHSRAGYYDNLLFHRVIKDFMIQTGDPLGDGTGGTSIWGREFEDEIHRNIRFDRAGVVAMANAGPGTNGSQFFISTVPCPWLDGKHTILGRVTRGMDVVKSIEAVPTRTSDDKPYEDIRIINIDIR